jgi:SPP1 family predicted phage head-tail adaptor
MRAGELRHRLILQQPTQTRDNFGEMTTTWTDVARVWGAVEPASGRRYFEALQANAEVSGVVRIRYRSDIDPTWRISHNSRTLEIVAIRNLQERNRELLIYYKEAQD